MIDDREGKTEQDPKRARASAGLGCARASKSLLAAALCVLLAWGSGCVLVALGVGAGAGAAGVAYSKGKLEGIVRANPKEVQNATDVAFGRLSISRISVTQANGQYIVVGRTNTDTKVTVEIAGREEGVSSVSVRVGVFGDEPLSRRIYEEIKKSL